MTIVNYDSTSVSVMLVGLPALVALEIVMSVGQ